MRKQWQDTAVGSPRTSKKHTIAEWLETRGNKAVTVEDLAALRKLLAPVSESYLRKLLLESGAPLDPLVEGVRQTGFEDLERTLANLSSYYAEARLHGDTALARLCRKLVLTAKDHAKLALRRGKLDAQARSNREEMLIWMFTWLENPAVFPEWVAIRKRVMQPEFEE